MNERALLNDALAGEPRACRALVAMLTPIVQARVARALIRRDMRGRNVRQEVEDLTQDVFLALFAGEQNFLRSWRPELGLSLQNFVGLFAQRRVASILRIHKRAPWFEEPVADPLGNHSDPPDVRPEGTALSRELIERLLERLEEMLSPRGFALFVRLYVHEDSVDQVSEEMQLKPNAVHQWKHRLGNAARAVLDELTGVTSPLDPSSPTGRADGATLRGRVRTGVGG